LGSSSKSTLAGSEELEGETVAVQNPPGHTLTGDFRRHPRFRSRFLPSEHTLLVYRPPGYRDERVRRFPVLYLHDGQNVFDRATSATGEEWSVDETAQRLIESGVIEPIIIVGIYNAGHRRIDQYTPTRDPRKKVGGKADAYARMLVQEIKPFIDRRYRTLRSAANTGLGGSSLGGLLTMHLGLRYHTVFNRLAVLSPSVWWNDRAIVREVEALTAKPPLRIWLDSGTGEGADVTRDTRLLRDALVRKGWASGRDLAYLEAEGGGHNEQSWAKRVEGVLRFLFPAGGR
jgi:predicted alpha/beta superfamily hydrolase